MDTHGLEESISNKGIFDIFFFTFFDLLKDKCFRCFIEVFNVVFDLLI